MIEIKASIQKKSIAVLGALKGVTNTGGKRWPSRSVVFVGFIGALKKKSGLYEGVFRFSDEGVPDDAKAVDLEEIFKCHVASVGAKRGSKKNA